jgi:hypothetical protein
MKDQFDATQMATLDFLRTELETGLTFARVALSARDEDKIRRNQLNAQKAYDTFCRYFANAAISEAESNEMHATAAELKGLLGKLDKSL